MIIRLAGPSTVFVDRLPARRTTGLEPMRAADAPSELAARWGRIGGPGAGPRWTGIIDLERLLVATAASGDDALLDVAASWLAVHHMLVFGRRLARMADGLATARLPAVAMLGVLLERSWARALALPNGLRDRPENLEVARDRCRSSAARDTGRSATHPAPLQGARAQRFVVPELIRPVEWVVRHVPELRVRALIGATLEAEIMVAALARHDGALHDADDVPPPSVAAIARHVGCSSAGVHGAANRLVRRGLLLARGRREGYVLRPTALALTALGWGSCETAAS